ncbi:MAG: hypothetical protein GY765_36855 [bacterium]|nr:hypothetical protein [bacterium]
MKKKLSLINLNTKQLIETKAGREGVRCACAYANNEGSSTSGNSSANISQGKWSILPCRETFKVN